MNKQEWSKYSATHSWVYRHFGKANHCENSPNCVAPSTRYEWANISSKYIRERSDWKQLCVSCHKRMDYKPRLERDKKVSQTLKGKVYSHMKRQVDQLTLDGKFIKRHGSMKEASLSLGLSPNAVTHVANGHRPTAGGFKWKKV